MLFIFLCNLSIEIAEFWEFLRIALVIVYVAHLQSIPLPYSSTSWWIVLAIVVPAAAGPKEFLAHIA